MCLLRLRVFYELSVTASVDVRISYLLLGSHLGSMASV